jgi:hypothetical protein
MLDAVAEARDQPDMEPVQPTTANRVPRNGARNAKVLERARKRFDRCVQAEAKNRAKALEDLKFYAGEQWPAEIQATRNTEKRPCLTINKIPTFVNQVTNDIRQNRPAIHVSPVGEGSDKQAAKIFYGLIRSIERNSRADIAYDRGAECAARAGFGYWRILTEFESDTDFNQRILIRSVRNPMTVYLDPDHQEPDGSDTKFGFVTEMVDRDEFKDEWPDKNPCDWSASQGENFKNWITDKQVRIAEYYEIEKTPRRLVLLETGFRGWKDELHADMLAQIKDGTVKVMRERDVDCAQIKWYKLTAHDVLDETDVAGRWIPIVKVIGDEIDIQGEVIYAGVVRHSKDSQRMYNYWKTAETEQVALMPKAPFIMEEGQVEGHEAQWKNANRKSYPYLLYKGTNVAGRPAPPPQRQPFSGPPAALIQAAAGAAEDMKATTGIRFDATLAERMHDESGRALRELKSAGDNGSFHYIDNLGRSLRHTGRILVDIIPKYLDTKRIITILREDDVEEQVQIDPSQPQAYQELKQASANGISKIFNPKVGEYGVTCTIGPSFATKRIEAAESMMDFAKALPNTAAIIADLIAKNQDWPGADEMAARIAKSLPANLITVSPSDLSPQAQALLASKDQQLAQLAQQLQQQQQALGDLDKDRAVLYDKAQKDFEAKVLKVFADLQQHMVTERNSLVSEVMSAVSALNQPTPTVPGALTGGSSTGQPPAMPG